MIYIWWVIDLFEGETVWKFFEINNFEKMMEIDCCMKKVLEDDKFKHKINIFSFLILLWLLHIFHDGQ